MGYNVELNKNKVMNSLVWKVFERLFSQGINLLVQIVLARILLPSDFGSVSIIVAITNYADLFVMSGISTAIIQRKDIKTIDLSTLLTSSLAIASLLYVVLFIAAPFIANYYAMPELNWALRVFAIILFLNSINAVQNGILSRKMQFRKIFTRTLISVPISGSVGIILALMGYGIWALVIHHIVAILSIVVFMSFDKELRVPLGFSWKSAKEMYSFSSKILVTSLITGGHDTIRTMVIGKRFSASSLAYYNRALTYSGYLTSTVSTSISSVLLPTFSNKQDDITKLKQMSRKSVALAAFIVFPLLIGFAVVCKPLVLLLLTEKWAPCIPFFVIFTVLRLPGCILSIDKQIFYAIGRSGIYLFYEIGLFIANISVLLYTVQISALAIAVGASIVEILGAVSIFIVSSKVYDYSLIERFRDLIKPMICSLIMASIVWCVNLLNIGLFVSLVLEVLIGVLVYIALSWIINKETFNYVLDLIKQMLNKKLNKQTEVNL